MVKPPLRTKSIGFKVSEEEYAQLETAAQADGRTLGEWCREVILRGGASNAAAHDPALAEIIGVRLLLVNVLGPVAAGEKVTPEKFNQLLDQISEAKHQLAANAENRVTSLSGNNSASYVYDAFGHRVRATISSVPYDFLYSGGRAVDEYTSSGWVWGDAGAAQLAVYANSTTYFSHRDWLGSLRAWSNVSGSSVGTCTTMPFGDVQTCTGTAPNSWNYAGLPFDSESGMSHALFRQLSTTQGRWTTSDPAGLGAVDPTNPQTWNRYAYVLNNPLSFVDRTGLYLAGPGQCRLLDGCTTDVGGGGDGWWFVNIESNELGGYYGAAFYFGDGIILYDGSWGGEVGGSGSCSFNIAVKNGDLLTPQEWNNASNEISRILSLANIGVNFTNSNPDFTIKLAENPTGLLGQLLWGQDWDTLGQNNAWFSTPTNSATVWVNSTEMAAAGMDMGIAIGRVMTHEFGHWAFPMVHSYPNPNPLEVDIMSQGFDDLLNGNATLSGTQIKLLRQRCLQLRSGG